MSKREFILRCRACGKVLSVPVVIYQRGDKGTKEPFFNGEDHVIESGFAFQSMEPFSSSLSPLESEKDPLDFTPQFWMTSRDLLSSVKVTDNHRRLNGCCGLDGCDGPNMVCECGVDVGTIMTDCWTSCLFIPEPEQTEWVDAIED